MDTDRAELQAVLSSFQAIMIEHNWLNKDGLMYLQAAGKRIQVVSDREALVGGINGVFKHNTNPDLWVQFDWYARLFDISARHVKRETHFVHNIADALASEMRIVIKDFVTTQRENNTII